MPRESVTRERFLDLPISGLFQLTLNGTSKQLTDYSDISGETPMEAFVVVFRDEVYFCIAKDETEADTKLADATKRNLATQNQIEIFIRADGLIWAKTKSGSSISEVVDIKRLRQSAIC